MDMISVGPCNLTILNGCSSGEIAEVTGDLSKQQVRDAEVEKASHILQAYVNRMYEILDCDDYEHYTCNKKLQKEKIAVAASMRTH